MDAKLVVVGGEARVTDIDLDLPLTIGRGRSSGLALPHPLVSRQHCEIYEEEGKLVVNDLGSLNGTFVGNQRINEPTFLMPGELLTVGTVTFRAVYQVAGEVGDELTEESTTTETPPAEQTVKIKDETISDFEEEADFEDDAVAEVETEEADEEFAEIDEVDEVDDVDEVEDFDAVVEAEEQVADDDLDVAAVEEVNDDVDEFDFAADEEEDEVDELVDDVADEDVEDFADIEEVDEVDEVEEVADSEPDDADDDLDVDATIRVPQKTNAPQQPAPAKGTESPVKPNGAGQKGASKPVPTPKPAAATEVEDEVDSAHDTKEVDPPSGSDTEAAEADDDDLQAFLRGLG